MKLKIQCDYCGREFERDHWKIKDNNYCSRSCLGKSNGVRNRRHHIKKCDYCGKDYEYKPKHSRRNKHNFCCKECSDAFKVKKVYVHCDWCGRPLYRKKSDVNRNKHNFCDRGCYIDFINFEKAGAPNQRVMGKVFYRKLVEMDLGRELLPDEEVHHIDGNHLNNDSSNLEVITSSEHAKIHAAKKERDANGRFVAKK